MNTTPTLETPRSVPKLPHAFCTALILSMTLTGCTAGGGYVHQDARQNRDITERPKSSHPRARISAAQSCAIGFNLSEIIYDEVSLRATVLLAPRTSIPCETYALGYLARAGFAVDRTGQGGSSFDITLTHTGTDQVSAVAQVGQDLRIARSYRLVRTGVVALGPVSYQRLNPDIYTRKKS